MDIEKHLAESNSSFLSFSSSTPAEFLLSETGNTFLAVLTMSFSNEKGKPALKFNPPLERDESNPFGWVILKPNEILTVQNEEEAPEDYTIVLGCARHFFKD